MNKTIFAALLCALATISQIGYAQELVRYPMLSAFSDPQSAYALALMKLALDNSDKSYQLLASPEPMQQARAILDAASPQGKVDVLWTMTTKEREEQLLPVRIPIDKGLLGWRIALVKREHVDLFTSVHTLQDMRAFKAGQEHDWPDTPILKSNGIPVVTATSYEALFSMLNGQRFDYFPRSVMEIWNERKSHSTYAFEVEKKIVLHYPAALYFFVTPRRPELAEDLRHGLEKAVADGGFEKLFHQYLQPAIKDGNIGKRLILELNNPLLGPNDLPGNRPELWYHP